MGILKLVMQDKLCQGRLASIGARRGLSMFALAMVLSLGFASSALCCLPATWDSYTAISGGIISGPSPGVNYPVNAEVPCSVSTATDVDHRYAVSENPRDTYPADTMNYVWSATAGYFKTGNLGQSVTWVAPSTATNSVTITCTVMDMAMKPPNELGSRDDVNLIRTVTTGKIYMVTLSTLTPTPILTGAKSDSVHQATVRATVTPVMTGSVTFAFDAGTGQGHSVAASFSPSTVSLDGSGQAQTVVTSSDLVESLTIKATFLLASATTSVPQCGWTQQSFAINPTELVADGQATGQVSFIIMKGASPVVGHSIAFEITSIVDTGGAQVPSDQWANYCTISPTPSTTDATGKAICTFTAGRLGGTVNLKARDNNVWNP